MIKRIGIAAVFLAGCAVGGGASQLVVPQASAQQAATLTKWETSCAVVDWEDLAATGTKFGTAGWEMLDFEAAAMGKAQVCFKRPKM